MSSAPAAFMSYARFNDEHDDGQLSAFRRRLAGEITAQTGREFEIFQDRADVEWGQNWQRRINDTLDVVTLLLVIITPGLFASTACRAEMTKFLERERALGRDDLILPVYYISATELDDPAVLESDELARELASRQYADWRELRFEPFTSSTARRAMAELATRMRDTFWRDRVTPKNEPPTHVVDAWGRGDFSTVGEAINAAQAGDRIVVRPGLYDEGLVVDKPLEILGDGPVEEIVIRARGADALLFQASIGRVANLTLRQAGGDGLWFAVDITQGRLDLEGCDISSQGLSCVAIHDGADPRLRRNRIHGGQQNGVFVFNGGLGTLEDNDISANAMAGAEIKSGGDPTMRRNKFHDGRGSGVYVNGGGLGTLEDNDIIANARAGVRIRTDGNPTLRHNRIHGNGYKAVRIHDGGRGILEDNDLTGNTAGAWDIAADCQANVTRTRNKEA